jgi:hypothetical protein
MLSAAPRILRFLHRIRGRLLGQPSPEQIDRVREAVARHGRWEQHVEWRISTVTSTLIAAERSSRRMSFPEAWHDDVLVVADVKEWTIFLDARHG